MSSMNFTCDSCGREVFGCTFVNGMKFCARCYQETFGETDKDRKIAELQKQLEEKEKELLIERTTNDNWYKREVFRRDEKIKMQRQQLKNQPAEIVEKIKKQIFNHFNVKNMEEYENLSLIDSLFTADAVIEMLDTILKEYQK